MLVEHGPNGEFYWCVLLDFPQILFKTTIFSFSFSSLVSFFFCFLYSSLVSFAFCVCMCCCCCFSKQKISIQIHIRLCRQVSDKRVFIQQIYGNKTNFFGLTDEWNRYCLEDIKDEWHQSNDGKPHRVN